MNRCLWAIITVLLGALIAGCRGEGTQAALPSTPGVAAALPAAAAPVFTPLGPTHMSDGFPTSGKLNALARDPNDPKVLYVAGGRGTGLETYSSAGIYRTADGGRTWQAADAGLTGAGGMTASTVNALWIAPAHSSVLLAATEFDGIFRSADGGTSWKSVAQSGRSTEFAFFGGSVYAATAKGVLASSDGGASWKRSLGTIVATAIAAVEGSTGNDLVAGAIDGSIYSFAGGTWTKQSVLPFVSRGAGTGNTAQVHEIAIDPLQPATIYASSNDGTWDQELFASTDSGKTWTLVLAKRYSQLGLGTQAAAFSAVHPHRLYIGEDGNMFWVNGDGSANPAVHNVANHQTIDVRDIWTQAAGSDDTCWLATDQGLDKVPACSTYVANHFSDTVVSATLATGLARHMAIGFGGRTLVVSLQDFSSHVTVDGGAAWKVIGALYEDGFNEIDPAQSNLCYALDDYVFRISKDGCRGYRIPSGGAHISGSRLYSDPLAIDPSDHRRIFAAGFQSKGRNYVPGVYATTDGGNTFVKEPWSLNYPGSIHIDARNPRHIVCGDFGAKGSRVSVTFDGGAHWFRSSGVIPTAYWYSESISPADSNLVLAMSIDASSRVFVLRSLDGGRTFKAVATLTTAPLFRRRIEPDVAAKTALPAYVYSPAREVRFNDSTNGATPDVVATTLNGAYLSTDSGSTWRRLDSALISHSFWGTRWSSGYLYLASDGQGVLRSEQPIQP